MLGLNKEYIKNIAFNPLPWYIEVRMMDIPYGIFVRRVFEDK